MWQKTDRAIKFYANSFHLFLWGESFITKFQQPPKILESFYHTKEKHLFYFFFIMMHTDS